VCSWRTGLAILRKHCADAGMKADVLLRFDKRIARLLHCG